MGTWALTKPVHISYNGGLADSHIVDAGHLGQSIMGIGKLWDQVASFYLNGDSVSKRSADYLTPKIVATPLRKGSVAYEILVLLYAGQLPLYAPILFELAQPTIDRLVSSVMNYRLGNKEDAIEMAKEAFALANKHADYAESVHKGQLENERWLREKIDFLSSNNNTALKNTASPVGQSCNTIRHLSH